jgi:membrane-associated protease RseP (regulator of RpoE activity)
MKKLISRIALITVCLWTLQGNALAAELLIPGGQIIGLQLCRDTVTVAAFDDKLGAAGKSAGLQIGDEILSVNGRAVSTAEDVRNALERSDGTVEMRVNRQGREKKLKLTLALRLVPSNTSTIT